MNRPVDRNAAIKQVISFLGSDGSATVDRTPDRIVAGCDVSTDRGTPGKQHASSACSASSVSSSGASIKSSSSGMKNEGDKKRSQMYVLRQNEKEKMILEPEGIQQR